MPRLALSSVPPERADADLLVLPVAAGDTGPVAPPATAAVLRRLGADLGRLAPRRPGGAAGRFTGALDDVLVLPGYGAVAAGVLLVGVGPDAGRTTETLRRAAAVAVGAAGKAATLAVALHQAGADGPAADGAAALAAVAEGTVLAAYRFQRHKSAPTPTWPPPPCSSTATGRWPRPSRCCAGPRSPPGPPWPPATWSTSRPAGSTRPPWPPRRSGWPGRPAWSTRS